MRILFGFFLIIISYSSQSQQISGIVKDVLDKPMANVTVSLYKVQDSSLVKINATNNLGKYEFIAVQNGNYYLHISHIGYVEQFSKPLEVIDDVNRNIDFVLEKNDANLSEVVVSSKKPMIEVLADKTVLNVEGSINAVGQDALDLLRKAPGVIVDKDDNLSLSGKNGVQVYIDGRPTPLSGQDLAAYLKTLQSSSIEAIEIITNPSAKYDAAGNAGIINIRLKKNKAFGTNGSVTAGYNIGVYPKYNGGISLNHRNKGINVFANYNYSNGRRENFMDITREQLDTLFLSHSNMNTDYEGHNFKTGMDYFISSKHTLGLLVNGNFSEGSNSNDTYTPIFYMPTGILNRTLEAHNSSIFKRKNSNINLNYRFADTSQHELNVDADYGKYLLRNDQWQPNDYFDKDGNFLLSRVYNFVAPTDINIYTLKADYEQKFLKGKLGFGGKTSFVNADNDFNRYDILNGGSRMYDSSRSNRFIYKENINAGYVNYNRQFKGFMVQFGVRMENTQLEGNSDGFTWNGQKYSLLNENFKRDYTDFFPSGAVTFNKNPMNQWGLRYSRRIDRPAYQDLNPFEFKLDEYSFQKGNINLRPQYTNSFALTHTYKFKLTTTLNYSHVKDVFTQLIDTTETSKSFMTKKNLATQDVVSLNVSYPFQYKSYSAFSNLSANYSHYKADFGTGRTIDLDAFAFNIFQQHSLKFAKDFTAELSGWYNSPSIWQGTFKMKSMWSVDAGIAKNIFKGKGNLKLGVSDIFNSLEFSGESNFAGQKINVSGGWESQQLKANFTYRFGSNQVKAARQRKTGLEEEGQRVGSGQGNTISQ